MKILIFWATMWYLTFPALLAETQHVVDDDAFNQKGCRHDMGLSMLMAVFPPVWIITPFITGFYENGFQFTCQSN